MRTTAAQPKARARGHVLALAALASIAAACGSSSETITAPAQARCAIAIEPDTTSFSPDGGTGALRVTTERECGWTARSEAAWVTLGTPASGQGAATIPFTVAANEAPEVRQATIAVNDRTQAISQQGRPCEFELSTEHVSVPAAGGQQTIEVDASSALCGWSAAADAPWITILSGAEGRGDGAVTVQVAAAAGPQRSGTLTIAGRSVRIDQGTGCTFSVTPPEIDLNPDGGDHTIRVDASSPACAWTASTSTPWITLSAGSAGSGNGTLTIRVAATTGPQRTGTLTVAGHTIRVNQGTGCSVAIDPADAALPAEGGSASIAVQSGEGCPWTAAANQAWISVASGTQGTGNARVGLSIAANTGPARSGTATIGGRTVSISQASGCKYSVTPATHSIGGLGGIATVDVSTAAGCPWTAEDTVPWLSVSTGSATGPGQVRITVQPNNSPARSSTVRVAGETVTVNQASLCTYTFAPPFHEFGPGGGNGNVLVIVTGSCTWTADSRAGWIQITSGTSGAGNGLVQFTVPPNAGPPRSGFIVIAGEQYRVSQGGS